MNTHLAICLAVALAACIGTNSLAQDDEPDPAQPNSPDAERELDEFRDGLFHAFNEADYEAMLDTYCHEEIITMWQDGTVGKGHDAVIAEFDKLGQFISKMQVEPTSENRLILDDGNTVISTGKMRDTYALSEYGTTVALDSSYVATLKKQDGKWQLVSFTASTDAFDNEVIDLYNKAAMYKYGGIGGGIGLILGLVLGMLFIRRGKQAAANA